MHYDSISARFFTHRRGGTHPKALWGGSLLPSVNISAHLEALAAYYHRIELLCAHVEDRVGKCGNRRPYHLGGRRHCGDAVEGNGGNTAVAFSPMCHKQLV